MNLAAAASFLTAFGSLYDYVHICLPHVAEVCNYKHVLFIDTITVQPTMQFPISTIVREVQGDAVGYLRIYCSPYYQVDKKTPALLSLIPYSIMLFLGIH